MFCEDLFPSNLRKQGRENLPQALTRTFHRPPGASGWVALGGSLLNTLFEPIQTLIV